jgi:hypothetical protein
MDPSFNGLNKERTVQMTFVWLLDEHMNTRKKTVMGRATTTSFIETLPTIDSTDYQGQVQI